MLTLISYQLHQLDLHSLGFPWDLLSHDDIDNDDDNDDYDDDDDDNGVDENYHNEGKHKKKTLQRLLQQRLQLLNIFFGGIWAYILVLIWASFIV